MSKEKECKSCQEEWYVSDIKEGLCPNCYDYFKQLKQQLEEKDKKIANLKNFISCKGCVDVIKKSNENQTQLAIQELEKVKDFSLNEMCQFTNSKEYEENKNLRGLRPVNYYKLRDFIDNQIKELKEGK